MLLNQNIFNIVIRQKLLQCKYDYFCQKVEQTNNIWEFKRKYLHKAHDQVQIPDFVDVNNQPPQYENKQQYLLDNFLPTLRRRTPQQSTMRDYVVDQINSQSQSTDLNFPEITSDEIHSQLQQQKTNSSPGIDKISNKILKKLFPILGAYLVKLFNQILRSSYHATRWKQHKMVPLLKPNRVPTLLSSWRPLSLLSNVSKLFEAVINQRFPEFLPTQKQIGRAHV
eukprot:TRINITY_DN10663_c1_g1_i4.p1 TRINITY_DN10663_c1_g1~~TRINITY_DN10663_c1_g1_i4.p1  ORF type:complete len:225 (+),score=-1.77 TRINITY_DN10663_c1_g1_i4:483-1157(+)